METSPELDAVRKDSHASHLSEQSEKSDRESSHSSFTGTWQGPALVAESRRPGLRPHAQASTEQGVQLWGRERELAGLAAFLDRALVVGGALLVVGEPGVGKTAFLDCAAQQGATRSRALVLRGGGFQFEAGLSFAGLHQLMLPALHTLESLPDPHRSALNVALGMQAGDPPDELLLATSFMQWLRQLSIDAPVILVFDDMQWTDRASANILELVSRRLEHLPVAAILTHRTEQGPPFDEQHVHEMRLGPLSDAASAALLRERFPQLSQSSRQRVLELAAGNPLALLELPWGLTTAHDDEAGSLSRPVPMTDRLRRLFSNRVDELAPSAREVLLLVALDGIDEMAIAPLIAGAEKDLLAAEEARVIRLDNGSIRFRHPLTRAAIVEMATDSQRRAAHARLAQLSTDPYSRAVHKAEAAVGYDDDAARDLEVAARRALERGDLIQAVGLSVRAAELTSHPGSRSRRLAEAAFLGSHIGGRLGGAQSMLRRARLASPDAMQTLESVTAAASSLANGEGGVEAAHRMLVAALSDTSAQHDGAALEAAVTTLFFICAFAGSDEMWTALDRVVEVQAEHLPPALVLSVQTFGDPARSSPSALQELDAIVAAAEGDSNPAHTVQVAIAGHYVGRMPARAVWRVVDDARAGGAVAAGATCLILLAADAFFEGRWEDALRLSEECMAMCEEHGLRAIEWGGLNARMLVAAGRGDGPVIQQAHSRMRDWAVPRSAGSVATFVANIDGLAALGEGRSNDAVEHFAQIASPGSFPEHQQVTMWSVLDVVEACVAAGRLEAARAHVAGAEKLGLGGVSPRLSFFCSAAAAYVAGDDAYEEAFERTLADPRAGTWPFHLARVEFAYGERLRHHREMRRARPHLQRAVDVFAALQATPWERRAAAALLATGRTRRRGYEQASTQLTPQEAEVARLAAGGLSNKQIAERLFLSARTVSGHLYRVFPKLGITSRAGLRDALTSLQAESRSEPSSLPQLSTSFEADVNTAGAGVAIRPNSDMPEW